MGGLVLNHEQDDLRQLRICLECSIVIGVALEWTRHVIRIRSHNPQQNMATL